MTEYVHKTYGLARAIVRDDDGTEREEELVKLGLRFSKHLEASLIQTAIMRGDGEDLVDLVASIGPDSPDTPSKR